MVLTDNDLMPFGKYKGTAMANVPASYLIWFKGNCKVTPFNKSVIDYITDNWDVIKSE